MTDNELCSNEEFWETMLKRLEETSEEEWREFVEEFDEEFGDY